MKSRYRPVVLDEKAREFLQTLDESPRTQETADCALKAFYSFRCYGQPRVGDTRPAPLALRAMGFDVLVNFNNWMIKSGYRPFSRDGYCAQVVNFLRFATRKHWMSEGFSLDLAQEERKHKRKKRTYPIPEVGEGFARVLHYFEGLAVPAGDDPAAVVERLDILRGRALMQTLYASAGRASEIVQLTRKQVQDGRRDEVVSKGKGSRERFLFFTPEAQRALQVYLEARQDDSPHVFINHERKYGTGLSRNMLWHIVHQVAETVGAEKVHPHTFRHARARELLAQGVPLEAIQEVLGHASILTTRSVYAHYDHKTIREIYDRATERAGEGE